MTTAMKTKLICFLLVAVFITAAGCTQKQPTQRLRDDLMGTVMSITAYGANASAAVDMAYSRIGDIHRVCDANDPASLLSAINNGDSATDNPDFIAISEIALAVEERSGGAFNPMIGALVRLWGISLGNTICPSDTEVTTAVEQIKLDRATPRANRIIPARQGALLDFGAVAKGYACDEAVAVLRENGIKSAVLDLGGNVYAVGTRPDGKPWKIGLRSPVLGERGAVAALLVADMSVVTSGSYERYFEQDGRLYHHILDPQTGYPAEGGLLSATVLHQSSGIADAYSTACFVLGLEKGAELVRETPGMAAVFITEDLKVYTVGELSIEIIDERFIAGGAL